MTPPKQRQVGAAHPTYSSIVHQEGIGLVHRYAVYTWPPPPWCTGSGWADFLWMESCWVSSSQFGTFSGVIYWHSGAVHDCCGGAGMMINVQGKLLESFNKGKHRQESMIPWNEKEPHWFNCHICKQMLSETIHTIGSHVLISLSLSDPSYFWRTPWRLCQLRLGRNLWWVMHSHLRLNISWVWLGLRWSTA